MAWTKSRLTPLYFVEYKNKENIAINLYVQNTKSY